MAEPDRADPDRADKVSRRAVARGLAWATPVVAFSTAAPAMAASPCGCQANGTTIACGTAVTVGFGGALNGNNWTNTVQGSYTGGNAIAYQATFTPNTGVSACDNTISGGSNGGSLSNAVVAVGDPGGPNSFITYQHALCLTPNRPYTVRFDWNYLGFNRRAEYLDANVTDCNKAVLGAAAQVPAPPGVSNSQSNNGKGSRSFSFTSASTINHTFTYTWTFGTTPASYADGCDRYANDIAVTAPTLSCT